MYRPKITVLTVRNYTPGPTGLWLTGFTVYEYQPYVTTRYEARLIRVRQR